ncbi:MAG: hypothetical protein H7832_14350 [Magnetococcus sp. DMHC-6]
MNQRQDVPPMMENSSLNQTFNTLSIEETKRELSFYIDQLYHWLEANGWEGWDPYDVWDTPFPMWARSGRDIPRRGISYLISKTNDRFPNLLRKLFGAHKQINAKAMGLFAASFLELEQLEGKPRLINGEPAYQPCFRWLDANRVAYNDGIGWGYPFDWQSRIFIPKKTPTVVNSAIIGDAYWHRYRYHNDASALHICEQICQFFVHGLNRSKKGKDGSFCFSYTPLDHFQVHNANLFGAEFLVRIGRETNREEWLQTGLDATRFSLNEIREDGTLNYWSNEQSFEGPQQDTYHSGFEIRALDGIAQATKRAPYREACDRYFACWRKDFFMPSGHPCFARANQKIVEVHSLAESLLCTSQMVGSGSIAPTDFLNQMTPLIQKSMPLLWSKSGPNAGYFASSVTLNNGKKMDIPFIRWGEAWMLRGLIASLSATNRLTSSY